VHAIPASYYLRLKDFRLLAKEKQTPIKKIVIEFGMRGCRGSDLF
jgi:hypothetical protein